MQRWSYTIFAEITWARRSAVAVGGLLATGDGCSTEALRAEFGAKVFIAGAMRCTELKRHVVVEPLPSGKDTSGWRVGVTTLILIGANRLMLDGVRTVQGEFIRI